MNEKITSSIDLDLDKLEALALAATPGPWHNQTISDDECYTVGLSVHAEAAKYPLIDEDHMPGMKDAEFIAAANPATVLQLIQLARRSTSGSDDWIGDVIRDVAELPDRDSPNDQPEILLVAADELRDIITSRAPKASGSDFASLVGSTVSVDVSTCDDDTGHRIFAELTGEVGSDGYTLLAIETSRNFKDKASGSAASTMGDCAKCKAIGAAYKIGKGASGSGGTAACTDGGKCGVGGYCKDCPYAAPSWDHEEFPNRSDGTAAAGAAGMNPLTPAVIALDAAIHKVLIAGDDSGDELSDTGLRNALKQAQHTVYRALIGIGIEKLPGAVNPLSAFLPKDTPAATSGSELAPSDYDVAIELAHRWKRRAEAAEAALAQQAATCQPLADERVMFEAAWRAKFNMPESAPFSKWGDGSYKAPAINDYYDGWLMARAALAHQSPSIDQQGGAPASEIQWRNIRKVVNEVAKFCFGGPKQAGSVSLAAAYTAVTTALTSEDGVQIQLESIAAPSPAAQADQRHHFACERKGYNPLCAGCDAEKAAAQADQDALRYRLVRSLLSQRAFDHYSLEGESGDEIDAWVDAAMSQAKGAGKDGGAK